MLLLPTAAGKTSICRAILLSVSVLVTVVETPAVWDASAERAGGICTRAEVMPSTTAVTASSAHTTRRRPFGSASAAFERTSRREK
jgi:hypothetical protein